MAATISPDSIESCRSINVSLVSSSAHKYVNYSKQMQIRLAEINDNVSTVIKESCTGIDNICNRVRECLFEMDQREKTMYLMDEVTEYEIVEEELRSGAEFSQDKDEICGDTSFLNIPEQKERSVTENVQTITPFFTVVNREENPSKMECCTKQLLTKTIYSLMDKKESLLTLHEESESGINLEHFKETVSTLCENFDMMNKLVENINKEIEQFSQTALSSEERSLAVNKKEINKSTSELKPIKRLSKSKSRQKSIQVGDCLSENEIDLEMMEWNDRNSESFIIPDVYRKRAFTDLYERLVAQVEANDSLIFFQTLMKRQKKMEKKSNKNFVSQIKLNIPVMNYSVPPKTAPTLNRRRSSKKLELDKKYAGSLWFSQKNVVKEKGGSKNTSRKVSRKDFGSKKGGKLIENKSEYSYTPPERVKSRNKRTKVSDSVKSLMQTRKPPKHSSMADIARQSCSLECTCKMVVQNDMPPSPSTKCHLQWLRAKPQNVSQSKIKFLDILDDLTTRDLLPLQSEYPRRDNQQPRELDYKDIQDTYLYKLMYGKQGTKNAWKQLLDPSIECSKKNCSVCKTSRVNSKKSKEEKTSKSFMDKFSTQNYSRSEIIKKLSPYYFDPEKRDEPCTRSVIVMPVRVYYENFKSNEPPTKLKSTNNQPVGTPKKNSVPTSKENKGTRRCEASTPGTSKPIKVVYDGLPKKIQVSPATTDAKAPIIPTNLPATSARLNSEKNAVKNVRSKSFSPKGFSSYSQREPADLNRHENASAYGKLQAELNKIRKDIYDKKFSASDKKLWASKYGKTVGQQLVSYIQHQEPESMRPLPKYAIPKLKIHSTLPEKKDIAGFLKEVDPHRQILSHVRNLKTKNDEIQDNIKKAIDVIERQMVDILHDDSNSVEAFDIMEREITSVLNLMKCNGNKVLKAIPSKSCTSKEKVESTLDINALENDYNIISDQLFDRLQRILDTGGSSVPSTPPEGSFKRKHHSKRDKDDTRKKQKLSTSKRNKTGVLSSSTSASMDEKVHVKRSPRLSSKKREQGEVKSKSAETAEPLSKENWERNCGDQNIIKIAQVESEYSVMENDVKRTPENKGWDNSEGDFTNQDNDMFFDVETDNTFDVISDDKVEKLLTAKDTPQTSDEVSNGIKDTDPDPSIVEMEELIKDELNKAIEKAETQKALVNLDVEDFIIEELDKAIKKAETLTTVPESGFLEHTINIEMQDYLNEELDKAITKEETMLNHPLMTSCKDTENDVNRILRGLISEELDEAIKKAETLASSTPAIPDKQRQIAEEIKEIMNEELDKAIIQAERAAAVSNSRESGDVPRHDIIADMKEFINEKLNKALAEVDTVPVSDFTNTAHEAVVSSDIREFIAEEIEKAIKKAENLSEDLNSKTIADGPKSIVNNDMKELINDELNRAIQKAEELAKFPDTIDDCKTEELEVGNEISLDSSITTDEEMCVNKFEMEEIPKLPHLEEENLKQTTLSPRQSPEPPKVGEELGGRDECDGAPNFSDQIHNIIKRVEDIYSQLDDIQNSDSAVKIPVFKDADIPDVRSEMFLTPFMQAVKETMNKTNEMDKEKVIEKSPSYYNVMKFLDTLNNLQKEAPYEIHVARLQNYVYIHQEVTVYYQTEIWHDVNHTTSCSERSGCLKSASEERRATEHKKVSFSENLKEDKSIQATLCPFHKIKAIRISSQQFPPVQQLNEDEKTPTSKNVMNEKASQSNEVIEIREVSGHTNISDEKEKENISAEKSNGGRCCVHKSWNSAHSEPNKKVCEIHGDVRKSSEVSCKRERRHCTNPERKHGECCEASTNRQLSVIGDKSTQVFCQMQTENPADHSASGERPCMSSSNNEDSTDCPNYMEDNPDDSKSTDKDFLDNSLIDPFYDYINENVNPEDVAQKVTEDHVKAQTKIVVFKQAPEDQELLESQESMISSTEIELYKKKLERRRELRLMRRSSGERRTQKVSGGSENVVLLKSFYAFVYILMFTALSLDYRCL